MLFVFLFSLPATLQRTLHIWSLRLLPPARKGLLKGLIDVISFGYDVLGFWGLANVSPFRFLMPPPPPPPCVPAVRKRQRDGVTDDPAASYSTTAAQGKLSFSFSEIPNSWRFHLWSCLLHEMASSLEEWGRRPICISPLVEVTNMFFLYMFFLVFPLFLLSTCVPGPACYGCVLCCRFIWYLPSLGCGLDSPLTWGSSMGFRFVLLSPLSPAFCFHYVLTGFQEVVCKKTKAEDASGLVPYGGDSSDEEEDRPHSSKTWLLTPALSYCPGHMQTQGPTFSIYTGLQPLKRKNPPSLGHDIVPVPCSSIHLHVTPF